ncbi:MAG: hypothetical protein MUD03_11530 [Pirellula sp.]|jgi:hypothetical protein|nr:hypothetical protein [Pirellula sp.]
MIDKYDASKDIVRRSNFSLLDLLAITSLSALIAFSFREGSRTESIICGYGSIIGSLLLAGLVLLVGTRFSRKSGASHRIIWGVIALIVTLVPLLIPFAY